LSNLRSYSILVPRLPSNISSFNHFLTCPPGLGHSNCVFKDVLRVLRHKNDLKI
jgi:hypothetical protein